MADDHTPTGSKVGRVIREYDLQGLGEALERRWLGVDGERESLRDLADTFNHAVLEAALERAGEQPIEGEIENHYRLLTGDDVSASARAQVETRLGRLGLDVGAVTRDFVSHQAVHTYLTDVRGASLPSDDASPEATRTNRHEAIRRLRNRLVAVVERSLDSLQRAGHLTLGEFDVIVSLTVYCEDCGTSATVAELFDNEGCSCHDD